MWRAAGGGLIPRDPLRRAGGRQPAEQHLPSRCPRCAALLQPGPAAGQSRGKTRAQQSKRVKPPLRRKCCSQERSLPHLRRESCPEAQSPSPKLLPLSPDGCANALPSSLRAPSREPGTNQVLGTHRRQLTHRQGKARLLAPFLCSGEGPQTPLVPPGAGLTPPVPLCAPRGRSEQRHVAPPGSQLCVSTRIYHRCSCWRGEASNTACPGSLISSVTSCRVLGPSPAGSQRQGFAVSLLPRSSPGSPVQTMLPAASRLPLLPTLHFLQAGRGSGCASAPLRH